MIRKYSISCKVVEFILHLDKIRICIGFDYLT